MNIYINILVEFLLISSSILILFKFRKNLGLAPLYILLGAVQYIQALSGTMVSLEVFGEYTLYPGSVIIFSASLFALLLIYIKEGVSSARALIVGIIISNFILSALFEITYQQEVITGDNQNLDVLSTFFINYKFFIVGTIILLLDFILLAIIYQFLISKVNKQYFFLILFISLFSVLIFDAFAFNIILKHGTPGFTNSLISHIIGKSVSALIFSIILYFYLKYIESDKTHTQFIAYQNRNVFSILTYRKKYLDLQLEKKQVEQKLTSQLEMSLTNISDGFISLDTNWCYTYINKKAADFLGKSPESLIGKNIWTEFPDGIGLPFYKAYYKAVETQKTIYFEDYYKPFDRWFENRVYPSPDGLTIYFTDITEQKKADEYNQILLSLIETSDDFIGLATLEGKPIYLNRSGRELIGMENDTEMPASISNFFPDDYQETITKVQVPQIMQHGKWKGEAPFQNFKTGALIPVEMSGFIIKDRITDEPIAIGNVARDISVRKQNEEQIIKSEKYLNNIINNIGDPLFVKDEQSRMLVVNDAFCEIFNLSRAEIIGKTLAEELPLDEMEGFLRIDKQVLDAGIENINEETLTAKGQKSRIISTKKTRFVDDKGIKFLIGTIRDITAQKKAEEEIRAAHQRLTTILNNSPVAIIEWDKNSIIRNWSVQAKNIFGWEEPEVIGKHLNDLNLVYEEDVTTVDINADELMNGKVKSNRTINRNYTKTNKIIYCEWYNSVLQSADGQIETIFSLVQDITNRKNSEMELEKYKNNLEELIKIRTEEVNSKKDELERMNKLFVGRELKMKELKNIIKELQLKNDN